MKKFSNLLFIAAISSLLFSCGKTENTDSFGKKDMFTNYPISVPCKLPS
jgi:hypothetical protein